MRNTVFQSICMGTVLFWLAAAPVAGQNREEREHRHRAGAGFGFTFIPLAGELGETDARGLFVPSLRLDYFYHLYPRWAVGFMANYELGHYMIIQEQIERDHALGLTLVGMFDITRHLGVFAGAGVEIEPHRHLGVFRLGTEYSIDLGKSWTLVPRLYLDAKKYHNTWSIAVSLSKEF
jgi:hypothetical protein